MQINFIRCWIWLHMDKLPKQDIHIFLCSPKPFILNTYHGKCLKTHNFAHIMWDRYPASIAIETQGWADGVKGQSASKPGKSSAISIDENVGLKRLNPRRLRKHCWSIKSRHNWNECFLHMWLTIMIFDIAFGTPQLFCRVSECECFSVATTQRVVSVVHVPLWTAWLNADCNNLPLSFCAACSCSASHSMSGRPSKVSLQFQALYTSNGRPRNERGGKARWSGPGATERRSPWIFRLECNSTAVPWGPLPTPEGLVGGSSQAESLWLHIPQMMKEALAPCWMKHPFTFYIRYI